MRTVRQYRKKPIVIEAVQVHYTSGQFMSREQLMELPSWFHDGLNKFASEEGRVYLHKNGLYVIATLEGLMEISPGDYVIRGVKGELYPCKADIFEATYDAI